MTTIFSTRHRNAKIATGIIVISFGILFLLDQLRFNIPNWTYSWKMILIAIGAVNLYRHNFRNVSGYILIFIGGAFLLKDLNPALINARIVLPVIVIGIGISILLKTLMPKKKVLSDVVIFDSEEDEVVGENYVESAAVFGGVDKTVLSKNFKGANIKSVFGGTELNLSRADIKTQAVIETTTAFGGTTLIIPSDWQVQSDLTAIFGGVEDKRAMSSLRENSGKLLVISGTCFMGGIEIQSH